MSKATLYHCPGTRSSRVAWFFFELDELGYPLDKYVTLKYIDLTKGEHKQKEYLKINPMGTVPTYINENNEILTESAAILLSLCEQYKEQIDLLPKDEKFFQWIAFTVSTLDNIAVPLFFQLMFVPEEKRDKKLIENKTMDLKEKLSFVSKGLDTNDYFIDNRFTIIDIIIGITLNIVNMIKLLEDFPKLQKYVTRISSREAFKRAHSPEETPELRQLKQQLRKMKEENSVLKGEVKISKPVIYHLAGTRSTRVIWLLNEIGIEHDIVDINKKGFTYVKGEEYLSVSPNGTLPGMVDGNLRYFEAGAIIQYILKKYPNEIKKKKFDS